MVIHNAMTRVLLICRGYRGEDISYGEMGWNEMTLVACDNDTLPDDLR